MVARRPYPSDASDEEWALVAPYLTLLAEGSRHCLGRSARAQPARGVQRPARHPQDRRAAEPSAAILDSRTLHSTPESGERAGYDGVKRKHGSKLHLAVDTLGHLLALHVSKASADDRA